MKKCIELKNKFISKNSLNNHFRRKISQNCLLDTNFIQIQHKSKIDISIKLLTLEKKKIEQDNILAELSFGFFLTFFKSAYKNYFRYNELKQIFPNLPSSKNKSINNNIIYMKY